MKCIKREPRGDKDTNEGFNENESRDFCRKIFGNGPKINLGSHFH